jgi:hypothetical protein
MDLGQLMQTMKNYRQQFANDNENNNINFPLSKEFEFLYSQLWPKNIKIVYHYEFSKSNFQGGEIDNNSNNKIDINDEKSFPKLKNKNNKKVNNKNITKNNNNSLNEKKVKGGEEKSEVQKEINFSHLDDPNIKLFPILLYCYKQPNIGRFEPIHAEANGAIIDFRNWTVLARPPPSLTPSNTPNFMSNRAELNTKFADGFYEMTEVEDGTVLTFYINDYFSNETKNDSNEAADRAKLDNWHLSTARGFNVKDLKWVTDVTYRQAFVDTLAEMKISFEELYSLAKTKNLSFTFNFKHPSFQPTTSTKSLTFLCCWSQDGQRFLGKKELNNFNFIEKFHQPTVVEIEKFGKDLSSVLDFTSKSLVKYCDIVSKIPFKNIEERQLVKRNFGFILRRKKENDSVFYTTSAADNIFIESSIMSFVRKAFYEIPKFVDQKYRLSFVQWNNFLTSQKYKQIFLQLFPHYSQIFYIFNGICKNIIADILNKTRAAPHIEVKLHIKSEQYKALINTLLVDLGRVSAFDTATSSLVSNLVYDKSRCVQYAVAFTK